MSRATQLFSVNPEPPDHLHLAAAEFAQALLVQPLRDAAQTLALFGQPLAQHLVRAALGDGLIDRRVGGRLRAVVGNPARGGARRGSGRLGVGHQ